MSGKAMAINDGIDNDIPLLVQGNGSEGTTITGSGSMNTTNSSSLFTGSSTVFTTQVEGGDVIEKSTYVKTVKAISSDGVGFFDSNWTDGSGSATFRTKEQDLFQFKDAAGTLKFKLEQNGGLALGLSPARTFNTWFTIDNDSVNDTGGVNKTGMHFTNEEAAIQIGGSAGDIGSESILIDQAGQYVGIKFKRTSHTDYKIALGNSSGLIFTRDPDGSPSNQMIMGSEGMRVGASVSGAPSVDMDVEGDVMVRNKRIYLGTSTSASSSTTAQILCGTATPTSGLSAPKGSVYLKTNGTITTTLYVKYGTGNTNWRATY
jgi:hypothetical protein